MIFKKSIQDISFKLCSIIVLTSFRDIISSDPSRIFLGDIGLGEKFHTFPMHVGEPVLARINLSQGVPITVQCCQQSQEWGHHCVSHRLAYILFGHVSSLDDGPPHCLPTG